MISLIELKSIYQNELSDLYSKNEIKSIVNLLIEFEFNKKPIFLNQNSPLSDIKFKKILLYLKKLELGHPVNYIIGHKSFYDLKIKVNNNVLIPRGETEELVHWVLQYIKPSYNILDLCTGSGCISVALAAKTPTSKIIALDISKKAINLAIENAKLNNVSISFLCLDILNDNLDFLNKQNIIVSNPPYVLNSQKKIMHKNVLHFEPHLALFVDDDNPLIFYKKIINISKKKLFRNGFLFLEINDLFSVEIKDLLKLNGFKNVTIKNDIHGKPRLVKAQLL